MKSWTLVLTVLAALALTGCGGISTITTTSQGPFTVGATVTGLSGTLMLQDNVGDSLTFTSNATQTFATTYTTGASYTISVVSQPTGQTCTLGSNSTGTATANVTVAVTCASASSGFTISAAVTGLTGTLMLQDDVGDSRTFTSNTTQTFATTYASGATYAVTVASQPAGQTCSLGGNSTGTITAPVTVAVTCTTSPVTFTISAAVSGLTGGTLVLQDNGGDNLSITANGTFLFATPIPSGGVYDVTVLTQPTGQTCAVTSPMGNANAPVTVAVTCAASTFSLRVTVTGLVGTLVLDNTDDTDVLTMTADGTYTFPTPIPAGGAYNVTVQTQPAGQTCVVASPTGNANANVTLQVTCAATTYTISATVTGLSGTLKLSDDVADSLTFTSNITQTFATSYNSGATYTVSIATQPVGQTCTLSSNSHGTITANVTVAVTCSSTIFTISATVTGLSGGTLALQDDVGDSLSFTTNTTQTFATAYASGATYTVSVSSQPSGQTCTLSGNSTGTITANVTVTATCTASSGGNTWTWVNGPDISGQPGVYGTKKVAAPGNVPGARYGSSSWIDSSGNFWLFGGFVDESGGNNNYINDLWEFSAGEWTWISGCNCVDQNGVYGTLGVASGTNIPGARADAVSWVDTSGNFWLFGGYGLDSNVLGTAGPLNDVWEFTGGQWIWQGGSDLVSGLPTYGTKGTAAPGNIPGARYWATGTVDSLGDFWLFGGIGIDSGNNPNNPGELNDLWEFSGGQWTWVSGSNVMDVKGSYGTLGSAGPGNVPGSREASVSWIDSAGNFWLFGGNGEDSNAAFGFLNDLWEFSGGEWTWQSGSNVNGAPASYGTEGVASSTNVPGSRQFSAGWMDPSGNFWLFGGQEDEDLFLNDLWEFSAGEWTWVSGSQLGDQLGIYGTLGQGSSSNAPGGRQQAATWADGSGNLWLFGGLGLGSTNTDGPDGLNDLWEFQPGSSTPTHNVKHPSNAPRAKPRRSATRTN